jgi:hypothetical protein
MWTSLIAALLLLGGGVAANPCPCTPLHRFTCWPTTGCEYRAFGFTGVGQDARMSWSDAQAVCQSFGANLASIWSMAEAALVANGLNRGQNELHSRWIGLHQSDLTTWLDGTSVNFTFWAPGEPNNWKGQENCVGTLGRPRFGEPGRFAWNDRDCSFTEKFVMKRQKGKKTRKKKKKEKKKEKEASV